MKTLTAQLLAHLNGELQTLATCVKITFAKYPPRIVAISQANPGVVTTRWAHDYETGDVVKIVGVRGMTSVNRQEFVVTKVDDFRFSIGVSTSGFEPYTHKGVARKVFGFTDHPREILFENVTYKSTLAYTSQSLRQGSAMAVDSVEHQGILQNAAKQELQGLLLDGITDDDLIAGFYDNAEMEFFVVNYQDLTMGRLILGSGRLGETTLNRGQYVAELVGKTAYLQETLQEVYTARCRADLGDDYDGSEPEHELHPGFGCKVRLDPPLWTPNTDYTIRAPGDAGSGHLVRSAAFPDVAFQVSVTGTSGGSEPAWNGTVGGTTVDGSVEWTTVQALSKSGTVHAVIDRRRWIDNDRSEAPLAGAGGVTTLFAITAVNQGAKRFTIAGDFVAQFPAGSTFTIVGSAANDGGYTIVSSTLNAGNTEIVVSETVPDGTASGSIIGRLPSLVGFFAFGKVTFLDGKNKGISREVRSFSVSTADGMTFTGPGFFEVFEQFPFDIQVGDAYEATAGCDKSLSMCVNKFDNVANRRAEDNIPGMDRALLYPDSK
jgi:hypothetical protein